MVDSAVPKVSVIITSYNSESTILATIQSIENQEGKGELFDLEIIVIDDCSTDGTRRIAESTSAKILVNERNSGGPNYGRNKGMRACSGDFICIADHDDIWLPRKLKTQIPFLSKVPIVTCGYTVIDSVKKRRIERVSECASSSNSNYFKQNETFLKRLVKNNKGQITYLGSIIFRRDFGLILFEEIFGQLDWDWILRLFHGRDSMEVCESLYIRNVDDSNLSLNESYRKNDYEFALQTIIGYTELYPKEVKEGIRRINGSLARYYYLVGRMNKSRYYFLRSEWSLKTLFYLVTSFVGSKYVKRKFNVFG
jgi:glycosyltransferase involved in cell wall biosynthesis